MSNKINSAEFATRAKAVGAAAKTLTVEIQALALASIAYVIEDGNGTPAAMLCNELGDSGARVKGLALYISDHCPISLNQDKETGRWTVKIDRKRRDEGVSLDRDEEGKLLGYLGEAAAEHVRWDRYSVENAPKPFDFDKAFAAFMKKVVANADSLDARVVAEKLAEAQALVIGGFEAMPDPLAAE